MIDNITYELIPLVVLAGFVFMLAFNIGIWMIIDSKNWIKR